MRFFSISISYLSENIAILLNIILLFKEGELYNSKPFFAHSYLKKLTVQASKNSVKVLKRSSKDYKMRMVLNINLKSNCKTED